MPEPRRDASRPGGLRSGGPRSGGPRRDAPLRAAVVLTAVALVGVIGVGAAVGSEATARDLQPRAREALDAAGLVDVEVSFQGREAQVGNGSRHDLRRAEEVVESVPGVRWARFDPAKADVDGPFLRLARDGKVLRISGAVADASAAADLKVAAADGFAVAVVGDLRIDPALDPPAWARELPAAFDEMVGLHDFELSIEGTTLDLHGAIESARGRAEVLRQVGSAVPSLTVVGDLRVDAGALSSDDAALLNTATVSFSGDGVELDAEGREVVDRVAAVLLEHPGVRIGIAGHVAPAGSEKAERAAMRRLAAVSDRLRRAGVAGDRLTRQSYGSGVDDDPSERDRRVDFVVKGS